MGALDYMKAFDPVGTAGKTDDELNVFVSIATTRLVYCVWKSLYTQGVALLALHLLHLSTVRAASAGGGAAGPLTMEIAGRVTLQYAKPGDWEKNSLALSPWGQEFQELTKKLAGRRMFNTGFRLEDMCDPNPRLMGESN